MIGRNSGNAVIEGNMALVLHKEAKRIIANRAAKGRFKNAQSRCVDEYDVHLQF